MRFNSATTIALLAASAAAYPDQEKREMVSDWDAHMVEWGYDYEIYTVTTEDSWDLTLFRITAKDGQEKGITGQQKPLLIMHGSETDAATWLGFAFDAKPMPLQLVDAGYDVWMGNNRGTRYSDVNPRWPHANDVGHDLYEEQNAQKYDWSFDEMGMYDVPAFIDQILAVSNEPKITYIGYSQGTTQMTFGLARKEEEYYADRVEKAIFLAPCLYTRPPQPGFYQILIELEQMGINTANTEDWDRQVELVCREGSEAACNYVTQFFLGNEMGAGVALKSQRYYNQIGASQRIQEYIPDFGLEGVSMESDLIPIGQIDQVPIQFMVPINDSGCTVEAAKRAMNDIPAVKTMYTIREALSTHIFFAWNAYEPFMNELINQIELDPYNYPQFTEGEEGTILENIYRGVMYFLVYDSSSALLGYGVATTAAASVLLM